jgi:GT2 family glycosyltransferase
MLQSLADQSFKGIEVLVADGSSTSETASLVVEPIWQNHGLRIEHIFVSPPNAVSQRKAAIAKARGEFLLLLDDDVVLEPDCVEEMLRLMNSAPDIVGAFSNFNNQAWPMPTRAWRFYMRHVLRMEEGAWQGKVIGPLLRFGYNPLPQRPMPMDWLGTCNTMILRSAYDEAGGFSNFFLHRCTMNEDVDLGLKLTRVGRILFCPAARMGHFHAPGGRVSPMNVAEDDLYNRYLVMHRTQRRSALSAFGLVLLYFTIETGSNLGGCIRRLRTNGFGARTVGRMCALLRILLGKAPLKENP